MHICFLPSTYIHVFSGFQDYPDYYEVIKNPIDMEKISHKLKSFLYNTLEEIVSDFILMFDNACKYNEPGMLWC